MSLEVVEIIDLGSHSLFICQVTESRVLSNKESMTYAYYHKVVKGKSPKNAPTYIPEEEQKTSWKCGLCGYEYVGEVPFEEVPEDYKCPICQQPKSVFLKK